MDPDGFREAPPEEVAPEIASFRVIDVREPGEYSGPMGHIRGAENVPLSTLEDCCLDWDRDENLLVVCKLGGRSRRACGLLECEGFSRLTNLVGGMVRWSQLDYEVCRHQPS